MAEYTEVQIEEIVNDAIEKTEKSFGGTFKRLKSENEQLKAELSAATDGIGSEKEELGSRISELESLLAGSSRKISELTVRSEIQRQLREHGPLPERFVDFEAVEFSEDADTLKANVEAVLEAGRGEFDQVLAEIGVNPAEYFETPANPTNPPSRDTSTVRDLRKTEARTALSDMSRRGLLR